MISVKKVLKNVYLLKDQFDFVSTLVIGKEKALVWDTTSGIDNVLDVITSITDLPLLVICSHGHFDHIGGSNQFKKVYLHKLDRCILNTYDDSLLSYWLTKMNNENKTITYTTNGWKNIYDLDFSSFELGELEGQIIHIPGHSLGSIGVYFPTLKLLLSGDTLTPIMTLFFQNHSNVEDLKKSFDTINNIDFDYFLTSHSLKMYPKALLNRMIDCLNNLKSIRPVKYSYPRPPFGEGYFYLHSLEEEPVGLIIDRKIEDD